VKLSKVSVLMFLLLVSTPMVMADYRDPYLEISKGNVPGHLRIHTFGHNEALSTSFETIWSGSNLYTYPGVATLMNISSSDVDDLAGDTGAWNVTVYGLDAGYNFINETLQLNGQNPVSTTLQYLRVYRMIVRESGTTGYNEGIIYLGTGAVVAGAPANKYGIIDANYGQTFMTQFTVPDGYIGYLTNIGITCYTANKGFEVYLRTRPVNESWLRKEEYHMVSGENVQHLLLPPMPIAPRTDIEFMGKVDVAGGVTEINYDLILVEDGYTLVEDVGQSTNNMLLYLIIIFVIMMLLAFGRRR